MLVYIDVFTELGISFGQKVYVLHRRVVPKDATKLLALDEWFFKTEPKKDKVPPGMNCVRCVT